MKIESYKKKTLTEEDFPLFKQLLDKSFSREVFEDDYSVLYSKSFNKESFLRLFSMAKTGLKNRKCQEDFTVALRLAYSLINIGEKYLEKNDDYGIENATAVLYEKIGFLLFIDDTFDFIPAFTLRLNYDITPNNKHAVVYFERAAVLDPNLKGPIFALGLYFLRIKNYHKAFAYLIRTEIDDYKNDSGYADLFTELGCFFVKEFEDSAIPLEKMGALLFSSNPTFDFQCERKAFQCFERAYSTFKNESRDKTVIYNLAYAYYEGIWVLQNKRKGGSLLKELDERLKAKGKDILKEDDPYGIIKKYYHRKADKK